MKFLITIVFLLMLIGCADDNTNKKADVHPDIAGADNVPNELPDLESGIHTSKFEICSKIMVLAYCNGDLVELTLPKGCVIIVPSIKVKSPGDTVDKIQKKFL